VKIVVGKLINVEFTWYCSAQLRDREHQIRRMETEQEELTKKLAVCIGLQTLAISMYSISVFKH
jgi:hypothetical protein